MGDSAYSFSLTTFSPTGKLLQIEHALNAVNKRGKTSLGIRAVNGVVLATNRKVPALVDPGSFSKIAKVTDSVGVVYSGLGPDSRVLLKRARKQAQAYYRQYLDPIPTVSAGRRAGGGAQVCCRGTPQRDAVRGCRAGPWALTTCAARGRRRLTGARARACAFVGAARPS
jgi:20S proteasome subunit alpha 2